MKITKMEMFKTGVGIVVSVGVGAIVGNAIKSTTPDTIGLVKKACVAVGAFVVSHMIQEKASEYVENKIDNTVKQIEEFGKNKEELIEVEEV